MEEERSNDGKRSRPVESAGSASTVSNQNKILNYPLPSSETIGCLVKIYADEELILNQIIEVVGIVSFNTPGACDTEDKDDFQPPSSIIPRIHCLSVVQWAHNNPHLSQRLSPQWTEQVSSILAKASSTRDHLHGLLTEMLMGDSLAADYVLCHLASNV